MAKLVVVLDVAGVLTGHTDPHELAEQMVEAYAEDARHNPLEAPTITFVSAGWEF